MVESLKRRKVLGTMFVGGLVQACGGGGDAATPPATQLPSVEVGPSLSALTTPLFIAHRGGYALYPEETYLAYDESVQRGVSLIECDVHTLADGALAVVHDETIDRTTAGTGRVAALNELAWRALRADAASWHGAAYGNDLALPLFKDWVQRYRGKAIFVAEDKDGRSMSAMVSALRALGVGGDRALLQSFSLGPVRTAVAAGYPACYLYNGSVGPAEAQAAGAKWAGMPISVADAELKKWIDSGLKVLLWSVSRRFQRETFLAKGVAGFFSSDPVYMSSDTAFSREDDFASGKWAPGMLGNGNDISLALRGEFSGGQYWGYSSTNSGYMSCLHGYLCPIRTASEPRDFELSLKITFDSALDNDPSRFASVFLGINDKPYLDLTESCEGYHLVFRKGGAIEVHKKRTGTKSVPLSVVGSLPIRDGEELAIRIDVTPAEIRVSRLRADGTKEAEAVLKDNEFHCTYLALGRNGLACRYRQISIS